MLMALVMSKTFEVNGEFLSNRQGVMYMMVSLGKTESTTASFFFYKFIKNVFWIGNTWMWYKIQKVKKGKPFPSCYVQFPSSPP